VVPAGEHAVEWRFFPPWLVASLFASWISLPVALLVLVVRRRLGAARLAKPRAQS
jgi:hypothetical protein